MRIFVCMVCGFDYDELAGDPARGIAPGTKWEDIPDDWVCPICGADKSMFEVQGGQDSSPAAAAKNDNQSLDSSAQGLDSAEALRLSTLFSNLAKGCEKQHFGEQSALFARIADFYANQARPEGDFDTLSALIKQDISQHCPEASNAAQEAGDRGAMRALKWHEKVTGIQQAVLTRYQKQGEQGFSDKKVYVCEACGFIFTGDAPPDICPVCKVPGFKFTEIKRRA